jgi:hypothetical protein
MTIDNNHIIASPGKVFRRIGSSDIFGPEIYLGYSYYIDGVLLETPHLDVPEDFEEIDEPEEIINDIQLVDSDGDSEE